MLIINDVHIGFSRSGGTTPASREALRDRLFANLEALLAQYPFEPLAVVGDLFDGFEVSPRDWLQTFSVLAAHLQTCPRLILVAGNHDHSPKATKVSSFEMLCRVLTSVHPDKVAVAPIDTPHRSGAFLFVPHCSNQDIFDNIIESLDLTGVNTVFFHANFDNSFAAQSDHSLNVTREQVKRILNSSAHVIFAHEHQARTQFGGRLVVMGNQWPTSIADCLGNDEKFAHVITVDSLKRVPTWSRESESGYHEIDWHDVAEAMPHGFVRITGDAAPNEASDVLSLISALRRKTEADTFVIGNAVKIEGLIEIEKLPESFESVKLFDVMDFLSQHLTSDEMGIVEYLLEQQQ